MNFDDLKEQLREQFSALASKVQESPTWIQLTEVYQNLSPNGQKAALAGLAALFTLILLALPMTFYFSSQESVAAFEDQRQLIRDLYRVSRAAKTLPPAPAQPGDLTSLIRSRLDIARLAPEQIGSVAPMELTGNIVGIPKALDRTGVRVNLSKLNLRQVVDIGHNLQSAHPSVKMTGLDIRANSEDDHYFDVVYQLVSATVAPEPPPKAPPAKGRGARGGG